MAAHGAQSILLALAALALVAISPVAARLGDSGTVMSTIKANPDLSVLAGYISQAGLDSTLGGSGTFTVFAPSNAAFAQLESYQISYLKQNLPELTGVLKYHVAGVEITRAEMAANEKIPTLQGSDLYVEYITNTTTLGLASGTCEKDVHFINDEVTTGNGLVQVVDQVLFPPGLICPDSLFFVEQRGEGRVGYTGYDCRAKGTTALVNNEYKPVGVAVDSNTQQVFWSNDMNAKPFDSWLSQVPFDGSHSDVFLNDLFDPQGMDTDTTAKKIYFTEHQGSKLHRANYDGSQVETLHQFDTSDEFPADVALDVDRQLAFVAVQSQPQVLKGKLAVVAFNGSNYRVLAENLHQNYGLCVDTLARHVYYVQGGHGGSINCYPYGDSPCPAAGGVVADGLEYPYMCTVDNLYAKYGGPTTVIFSEANVPGSVYAMNSDGSNRRVINNQLQAPMGVKLGCVREASETWAQA